MLLTCAAGASTGLGAIFLLFWPLNNPKFLAAALAASAGVMVYVSFIEIFTKSRDAFEENGADSGEALAYATLAFFGGVLGSYLLSALVHYLDPHHACVADVEIDNILEKEMARQESKNAVMAGAADSDEDGDVDGTPSGPTGQRGAEGTRATERGRRQARRTRRSGAPASAPTSGTTTPVCTSCTNSCNNSSAVSVRSASDPCAAEEGSTALVSPTDPVRMRRAGYMVMISLSLHNFPEGLITFVGALVSARLGVALCVAIAIHNIPEGVAVATFFMSTGSRKMGVAMACLSGLAEPVGALIGWAIISAAGESQLAYGLIFGVVAGMMIFICIKELLPAAFHYDQADRFVTNSFFAGAAFMALSLVLFAIS
jgi:ZIP family zinc transporter